MRNSVLTIILLSLLILPAPPQSQAAPRCFPEAPTISACIDGRIAEFWEAQGGLPVFGYPLEAARTAQGPAGPITVQRFERAELEHHPQNAAPYDIQLARLGAAALAVRSEPASPVEPADPACRYFAQTGLNVCGNFLAAYQRYGLELGHAGISLEESLALFGLPITAPRQERQANGETLLVQWFERARFEDHGAAGVLFGLLGSEAQPSAPTIGDPCAQISCNLEPGGFIQATGGQLTRLGQPVLIKGVNYYPQGRPWDEMWTNWNALQIERELRLGRDQLGINAVRVLLPYDYQRSDTGEVHPPLLAQLSELTQIAGDLDLRLIVTLFDFYETFPVADTHDDRKAKAYLQSILGNFSGDERIMAWDLHNEPDNYKLWARENNAAQVLDWLGRMADEAHRIAPNQLVTVGMGHYNNLWVAGPDGRRVIDYSDVVSVHIYNAADAVRQLDELRSHTDKPILLEEFGWPSGPACAVREYNEAQQDAVYRVMLEAAAGRVSGVMAWSLRDYHFGPSTRWEIREEYYGLFRADDSLKPAASWFQAYAAPPLPSLPKSPVPLSDLSRPPSDNSRSALYIAEGGHYVKNEFRQAWDLFNGRYNFGLPLSEAFVRASDRVVVQYFTGGVLELHTSAREEPFFEQLSLEEQLRRQLRFINIGSIYTQGRTFPPQQSIDRESSYYFAETGYEVVPELRSYFDALGGRWRFGPAISGMVEERIGERIVLVQYFENGRLERDIISGTIGVGNLGTWAWDIQCTYV